MKFEKNNYIMSAQHIDSDESLNVFIDEYSKFFKTILKKDYEYANVERWKDELLKLIKEKFTSFPEKPIISLALIYDFDANIYTSTQLFTSLVANPPREMTYGTKLDIDINAYSGKARFVYYYKEEEKQNILAIGFFVNEWV